MLVNSVLRSVWRGEDEYSAYGICNFYVLFRLLSFSLEMIREYPISIEAVCKGCDTCGAACPSGAITMHHFTDEQILTQLEALFS
jgi:heterodisulfide reductase subunit A